jgi:hypothetical protein
MADWNAALQEEATDLIDHGGALTDQARSYPVQCWQVQLIVGLYRYAACRWSLHSFCNRVSVPEVVLVSLAERPGISRRHLPHLMAERNQLARHIVRRHAGLDTDQAPFLLCALRSLGPWCAECDDYINRYLRKGRGSGIQLIWIAISAEINVLH